MLLLIVDYLIRKKFLIYKRKSLINDCMDQKMLIILYLYDELCYPAFLIKHYI